MSKDSTTPNRRKRDSEDQKRDREVYRYLLALSDLDSSGTPPTPNETSLAKQWGFEDNRIFIRRMLRSVLDSKYYAQKDEDKQPVPGLTLSKLVGILSALQKYQRDQQSQQPLGSRLKPYRIITHSEKRKALHLFFCLSADERTQLELPTHPGQALLDQILEKADAPTSTYNAQSASRLYDFFLQQARQGSSPQFADALNSDNISDVQDAVQQIVSIYTKQHFSGLSDTDRDKVDQKAFERVDREIKRIELQSGIEQANYFLAKEDSKTKGNRLYRYLTADFIHRLAHSVVDNELIADDFPIHIKYFEIDRVKPLPLYIKQKDESIGVLNDALSKNGGQSSVSGLERQVAYRIKVHFYIKTPKDYKPRFKDITVINNIDGQTRLEFFEEVVGIGCPTSHITAAIDRVLFWDISILKDYMLLADGIYCSDQAVGGTPNSPIWSHCVARLYKAKDVEQAIRLNKDCSEVATAVEVASANFCGFDLVETTAKAALHARLKLIKQTLEHQPDVSAEGYLENLYCRVEEMTALKRAKRLLSFYPFSLRAMEGQLEETIFNRKYRKRKKGYTFEDYEPGKQWSAIAIDAQLLIADANLKEGLTHIAKRCLEAIRWQFEPPARSPGDLLTTRYHLCWFRYYYLSDLSDLNCQFPDRYSAIRESQKALESAETCLQRRLRQYEKLDELPQANLNPQLFLLSRIHAHRAKLYIFFSNYMPKMEPWETLLKPVELLEKARIYAARDGDSALYAQWSAYQSWCYIMLAYLGVQEGTEQKGFSHDDCLELARRLVDHANLCYSETGKVCYQQIKDRGGRTTPYVYVPKSDDVKATGDPARLLDTVDTEKYYEKYGNTYVQVVPLIQELVDDNNAKSHGQKYKPGSDVVSLDVSLLRRWRTDEGNAIYLFGMQSSILLFAQGMLALCSDYKGEEGGEALIEAIAEKALRLFTYCCAIADDGTQRREEKDRWPTGSTAGSSKHPLVLDRAFPEDFEEEDSEENDLQSGDRLLQGLYPHRLTQFADLGKIFVVVCELILIAHRQSPQPVESSLKTPVKPSKETFKLIEKRRAKIRKLVKELRQNNQFPFSSSEACGQKRYNAHLSEHYVQIEIYTERFFDSLETHQPKDVSATVIRNKIVADVFRIVRGETGVLPNLA